MHFSTLIVKKGRAPLFNVHKVLIRIYGIPQSRDRALAVAAALTYWVFRCRDRGKSPAMGVKTWSYLESSIRNSAELSTDIETYLQYLCDRLLSHLRPAELSFILSPDQVIYRVNRDGSEIQQLKTDESLAFIGWHDLLEDIKPHGFTEFDVLDLLRTKAGIVQVLCRLRFEEDKAIGKDAPEEFIEAVATNV